VTPSETRAIVSLSLLAAFVDGEKHERERAEIKRIAEGLSQADGVQLPTLYQDVLMKRVSLASVAGELKSPEARQLAYEMAVCVCDADGAQTPAERKFLEQLRSAIGLDAVSAANFARDAEALAEPALAGATPASDAEVDSTILGTAVLCAALEQLPQRLATMAIVPLQMRMVYKIGAKYGFALDRGHIVDLLSAAGVGMASQMVDNFARGLVKKVAGRFIGSFLSGLAGRATSSAVAFGTTYALGHLAKRYYSGGRKLTADQLRDTFQSLVAEARGIESRHAGAITDRARSLNVADLAGLVRGA
jgi:uncharacterized protein (DUF697 family)/tellurite resistance protein